MALKFIILVLIVFTAVKACDLDTILDDLYEELESEEDDSKPEKSTTQAPTTTTSAPNDSSSTTLTPTPPTTPSAPSTTTPQPRVRGKLRRRSFHRRRHLLRKAAEAKGELGSDLYAGTDPHHARYAPNQVGARNLVYKPSEIIEDLSEVDEPSHIDDSENDELVGEGRSESVFVIPAQDEEELNEGRSMSNNKVNENIHLTKEDVHEMLLRSGGTIYRVEPTPPQHKHSPNRRHKTPSRHSSKKEKKRPSLVDIIIVNNYPTGMQNNPTGTQNNEGRPPSSKNVDPTQNKSHNRRKVWMRPPKPISGGSSDELPFGDGTPSQDMQRPCSSVDNINEMNRIKEHTIHETIKINPKDNSEIRDVEEKIIYSIIKKPCMSAENVNEGTGPSLSEAIANMETKAGQRPAMKQTMTVKDEEHIFVQQPPATNSQVHFHKEILKGDSKDSFLDHKYDIRPIDSNSGIHQQHTLKSSATPSTVGHDVIQEKNIYVTPNHHGEHNKYNSAPMIPNNSPSHETQHYPLMSEYNVYGPLPKFPINNPEIVHHPSSHSSIIEHDSRRNHPPKEYGYLQPPSVEMMDTFKESKKDGHVPAAHEHHHSMIDNPVTTPPAKIINVV